MPLSRWILACSLFLLACLALCGCALKVSVSKSERRPAGLIRTPSGLPAGAWTAVGRVTRVHGYLHRRAGEVLIRPWSFTTLCHEGVGCRTSFFRLTDSGPSTTLLVPHRGYFTADFPPVSVRCLGAGNRGMAPGTPGRMYSSYKLWWSADRKTLIGAERSASHDRCVPAGSQTHWMAVPSNGPTAPGQPRRG